MGLKTFDRDTLLDLTVNVIPLGIILFFIVAYAVVNPFGWDNLVSGLQFAIMVVTFGLLTILTYYAGKAVSAAEKQTDVEPGESLPATTDAEVETDAETETDAGAESEETAEEAIAD